MKLPQDFKILTKDKSWLLGFIFANASMAVHQGIATIRFFYKNKDVLEEIKNYYHIPKKVCQHKTKYSVTYYIRLAYKEVVDLIISYGYKKDIRELKIPTMDDEFIEHFVRGFIMGKGRIEYGQNQISKSFKIIFRSEFFINQIAENLSSLCEVDLQVLDCQSQNNKCNCELIYTGSECERIISFIEKGNFIESYSTQLKVKELCLVE